MRYLLTGDEAARRKRCVSGWCRRCVDPGMELARALEIAQTVAAQSPLGVQATLASARLARTQGEVAALRRLMSRSSAADV